MTFGKHVDKLGYDQLSPDALEGKQGAVTLTLSAGTRPTVSVNIKNGERVQTATMADIGPAGLSKIVLGIRPLDDGEKTYQVIISRKDIANGQATWQVDFTNHPSAAEWNRDEIMGYMVPMGNCVIESCQIEREVKRSGGTMLASFFA